MRPKVCEVALFLMLVSAIFANARAAADPSCISRPAASLPLSSQANGLLSIPATVNNHSVELIVDTGGAFSMMNANVAQKLGLSIDTRSRPFATLFGGVKVREIAHVESLRLGQMPGQPVDFAVIPTSAVGAADGTLGADTLGRYDIEIDFVGRKLNLFHWQVHCSGQVRELTTGAVAVVPMLPASGRHILIPVTLGGKNLTAVLDTGAQKSSISPRTASEVFNLDGRRETFTARPGVSVNGSLAKTILSYSFASLSIAGVKIQDADFQIISGETSRRNAPQLILGLDILRQMHIYVSYSEQSLYLVNVEP